MSHSVTVRAHSHFPHGSENIPVFNEDVSVYCGKPATGRERILLKRIKRIVKKSGVSIEVIRQRRK